MEKYVCIKINGNIITTLVGNCSINYIRENETTEEIAQIIANAIKPFLDKE